MNVTRLVLTAAAAAAASTLFFTRRAPAGRRGTHGSSGAALSEASPGRVDLHGALDGAYGTDRSEAAADSPNEAERLQASGVAGRATTARDDLFASTAQESSYAQAPGLPDFFRGA